MSAASIADDRGLPVSDLTDEHDVGVGTQDRTQRDREREAGLRVDLHLVDAGQAVLDRVLDRDDVAVGLVERVERRVERRRLARTGRAGHEDRAVRLAVRRLEAVVASRAGSPSSSSRRTAWPLSRIRMTTFSPYTVGQGRDTKVDAAPADLHADAAVLRDAALGDVDVGHDLQTADHAGLDAAR